VSSVRHAAVQVIHGLDTDKGSLGTLVPYWSSRVDSSDQALLREMCFGVARWSHRLAAILEHLLQKPLRKKDHDVQALLKIGLYQIEYMRVPDHAALNQTVSVARELGKPWAKGLVNGSLRTWLRERDNLRQQLDQVQELSFPPWIIDRVKNDWPDQWQEILANSNCKAPMTLRVNLSATTLVDYRSVLEAAKLDARISGNLPCAVTLDQAISVERVPGFAQGQVSVQDASAQRASLYLSPKPGERVLDACAAPGGKTCHLLEIANGISVTAIDVAEDRLVRVHENLSRLGFDQATDSVQRSIEVLCENAVDLNAWWNGEPYDAVMLDAPCSGSGVIRRHPDIKLLRRDSDLPQLIETQSRLLRKLWQTVKPGGRLLYATCSVFRDENEGQMQSFFEETRDAREIPLDAPAGAGRCEFGVQVLTECSGADGFYYCLIKKGDS